MRTERDSSVVTRRPSPQEVAGSTLRSASGGPRSFGLLLAPAGQVARGGPAYPSNGWPTGLGIVEWLPAGRQSPPSPSPAEARHQLAPAIYGCSHAVNHSSRGCGFGAPFPSALRILLYFPQAGHQ